MSKKTECVIFDLDGTLLDTSPGIIESAEYAAEKLGYPALSQEQLLTFIGPPLDVSFRRWYGCGEHEAKELIAAFRERYREGAMFHAVPYEGIFDLCAALQEDGIRLAVATSKVHEYAEHILEHFGFVRYFDEVHGADPEWKMTKADLIRLCARGHAPERSVMVGDTEHDARGAQEAGVPFLAVSYGFGNKAEMAQYPCIGVADTPAGVREFVVY